jgi:GH35 family endo-1,4-beta-xylanase
MMDVRIHGHILIWGTAKPYWIYDWFCPENEKEYFDTLGIPRHSTFPKRAKAGAEGGFGFDSQWKKAWRNAYGYVTEETLGEKAPQFAANMRKIFRKRILDVARDFGPFVDSWDVVNESCVDWKVYRKSRTALPVWKSVYGLMPGDYPLNALLDAKEAFPETTDLVINDYAINDNFLAQVKDLENEGARIDVVGCQMHIFNTNDCMRLALGATNVNWVGTPATIERRLDTMAKTGKPLHVSEVTITSPGMDDKSRQIQAILTRNIYRKWFSHKAAMGITWWNTVDGGGVYGEPLVSGLFTRDMKRKRAYDALDELINKEWRTKLEVKVKGEGEGCGVVAFRGFRGKYRLNWICDKCGEKHTRVLRLTGDGVSENASKVASPIDCYVPMAKYKVDGKAVILPKGERYVDLKKIYPNEVVSGRDGKRWAKVETSVIAPKDGEYVLMRYNEYWGEIIVNGISLGEFNGPVTPTPITLKLKKGENTIIYRTRAGSGGVWKCGLLVHGDSPLKLDI